MVYTVSMRQEILGDEGRKGSEWKGLLLTFIASIPFFTHGLETTALFASSHGGHFIRSAEPVPWNATILIAAAAVTAPVYCWLVDRFGRKLGIFVTMFVQGASCLTVYSPPTEISTYIIHALAGVSTGGLFTVIPIYIMEVNSIASKWSLSLMMLMTTVGYLMKIALGEEVMLYLMTALVIAQLMSVMFLLESPSYLVKAKKFEEAKSNLASLKCLQEDDLNLNKELQNLKDESFRARAHGSLSLISIQRNLIWRDATKISILLTTTMVLCGSIIFLDQDLTLMQLKLVSDPDKMLVLVSLCSGSLCTVLLIKFVEKKYLLTIGFLIMVLSMGILAVYTQADLTVTSLRWLPVVALGFLVFGFGISWLLPTIISLEMFNFEIRATMIGAIFVYAQIIKLIQLHAYPYIADYMGIYTLFYVFSGVNLYGCVYGFFIVPDLRAKTIRQVEKQLKRIPLIKL